MARRKRDSVPDWMQSNLELRNGHAPPDLKPGQKVVLVLTGKVRRTSADDQGRSAGIRIDSVKKGGAPMKKGHGKHGAAADKGKKTPEPKGAGYPPFLGKKKRGKKGA